MPVSFTAAEIAQKYDSLAAYYDRVELAAEFFLLSRLRRACFRRATGDVLEVAVGTGGNLKFYRAGCRITAIDVSQGMLEQARRHAEKLKLKVDFQLMDATALRFPDNSFDTVTSSLSTCTFPDPIVVLREMARVCRDDGHILLLENGRSSVKLFGWLQDRLADWHARRVACHWNRDPAGMVLQARLRLLSDQAHLFGVVHMIEAAP
jgi:ubiquinone/menaquinone biosynthesis C-methylase UbiE